MAGAILFDANPYIYYNDTWYSLGDSVEIQEGDGFWLYTKIKCTYDLASLGITVRLIVDTKEVGKEYTSISCKGAVTTVWVYCTATKEGTAKAELWMGDLNNLIETKYSWALKLTPKENILKVGTGIRTIGDCDAEITGESSTFEYGQRIYVLYRHGACVQLSAGNFKLYRDGTLVQTYVFPSYWGYVYYNYVNWSAGSYKVVCTIGTTVMTEHFTITAPPVVICDQPVTVVDEGGNKIDTATVKCYEGTSLKASCTTYYGECLLSFLDKGILYKAVATKEGYDCLNCEKTFTACTSTTYPGITLSLKKKPTTCNQSFIVKDTVGNTIYSNCIIVVREGTAWRSECATGTSGTCTATGLTKGKYLKACIEQVPTGYEKISESCKSFTACTSTITLKLKKKTEYCSQNVRVVTSDGKTASAKIDWGDGASEYGDTPKTFTHRYEKGKIYKIKITASGYSSPERTITSCIYEFTLTLMKTVEYCPQNVKVSDKDTGAGIGGVTVATRPTTGTIIRCTTDSGGRCTLSNLTKGNSYRLVAESYPTDYECQYTADCEQTIIACTTERTFRLKKKILTCEQLIKVVDEKGVLTDATVTVSGATCTRYATGRYKISLTKGDSLIGKATKSGYTVPTHSFTACEPEFTLTLAKIVVKKDTKLTCYDKTTGVNKPVILEAKLEEKAFPYNDIENGYVRFYIDGSYVDADKTDKDGKASVSYTSSKEGAYTIKAVFDPFGEVAGYNASECTSTLTVKAIEKKDSIICDFDVLDAEGKKVTDLVAGVRYTVRAWLCAKGTLPLVGGCNSIPTVEGCASNYKVAGETLNLFLFGAAAPVATGKTNVDGYASMYWAPSADIAGDNSVRMEFKGSTNYNKCESDWKTIKISTGKFVINVPKGIFGAIDKGYVMVYKVLKLPFIDAYTNLGLPGKNLWCETPPCSFEQTAADGLDIGGKYAIFPSSSISILPAVTSKCVYEFTDKVQMIDLPVYIDPLNTVLCGFFDLTPSECSVFLLEFVDPIYVANTLSVIQHHEDIMGNPREPETLDYVMLPIVMVGSLLPMIPMGKISQWTGRGLKLAKKRVASKTFLKLHHQKIHHLIAVGDETRILKFKALFDLDNLDEALKILNEGVTSSEATEVAKALKRTSLRNWVRGIRAKWKAKNPKTPIGKVMDDTAEHGGNVFKTQADTIVKHVDDANGDWLKIRKIWDDTVKTADDVVYADFHLVGKSDDFKAMHNLMRYTKDDYIKALKAEDALNPIYVSRFDEGLDFMLHHLSGEGEKYRKVLRGLDKAEIDEVVKNLRASGKAGETLAGSFDEALKSLNKLEDLGHAVPPAGSKMGVADNIYRNTAEPSLWETQVEAYAKVLDTEGQKEIATFVRTMGRTMPPGDATWKSILDTVKTFRKARTPAGVINAWGSIPRKWKILGVLFVASGIVKQILETGGMGMFMPEEASQQVGFGMMTPILNKQWDIADEYYDRMVEFDDDASKMVDWFGWLNPILKSSFQLYFRGVRIKHDIYRDSIDRGLAGERLVVPTVTNFTPPTKDFLFMELVHDGDKMVVAGLYYKDIPQVTTDANAVVSACNAATMIIGWHLDKQFEILAKSGLDVGNAKAKSIDLATDIKGLDPSTTFYELCCENGIPYVGKPYEATDADARYVPYVPQISAAYWLTKKEHEAEVEAFIKKRAGAIKDLYSLAAKAGRLTILGKGFGSLYVNSDPSSANIYLTGGEWTKHLIGLTDHVFFELPPATYTITLEKTGYKSKTIPNVTLIAGEKKTLPLQTLEEITPAPPKACFYDDKTVKVNESVPFDASCSSPPGEITSYSWDFGDGRGGTGINTSHAYTTLGKYTVTLTVVSPKGTDTAKHTINVAPPPCPASTASFVYSPSKPKVGETVTFTSNSTTGTGATLISWEWDFGDGAYGSGRTVTHIFTTKRIYHVKLTVKNDCCTNAVGKDSVTVPIVVEVPTGWIECYCTCAINAKPSYCASERGTKILVDGKEVGTTRESGYAKITLETGRHIVKYNLLNIMESSPEEIIVVEGTGAAYHSELKSILPTSQPAKVTQIIDGDSIRVDVVDREVRLIGYDAYEIGTAFGVYGKDKLTELIPVGSVITLKVDQYLPLDGYNRVIAGVFRNGNDMVVEMLKSCLVNVTPSKYHYKYYWIDWDNYELLWNDPLGTECLLNPSYKPLITDINTTAKTFKIDNRFKTLLFKAEFYDKANAKLGETSVMQVEGGKVSDAVSYFTNTYLIKLFGCISKCAKAENWVQTDYKFSEVTKKTVKILCDVDAAIFVNGVKVYPSSAGYLEKLTGTLRKYRT